MDKKGLVNEVVNQTKEGKIHKFDNIDNCKDLFIFVRHGARLDMV
jgi:hypothetical protein